MRSWSWSFKKLQCSLGVSTIELPKNGLDPSPLNSVTLEFYPRFSLCQDSCSSHLQLFHLMSQCWSDSFVCFLFFQAWWWQYWWWWRFIEMLIGLFRTFSPSSEFSEWPLNHGASSLLWFRRNVQFDVVRTLGGRLINNPPPPHPNYEMFSKCKFGAKCL